MSRTWYAASNPMSALPFPMTRLLGTSVARQSYNPSQPDPATGPHHHVPQTTPHGRRPAALRRAGAARPRDDAARRAPALGGGHEPEAAAARGAAEAFGREARRPSPGAQPAALRGHAGVDVDRFCRDGAPVG